VKRTGRIGCGPARLTALRDLQKAFALALTGDGGAAVEPLVVSHGIPPVERARIYVNNVRANFRDTMQIGFPATARLVGAGYFRQLVDRYQDQHPSRSGNLHHVGAEFAAHLRGQLAGSEFEYLIDVAAIEWAYQEILTSPEPDVLNIDALAAVAEGEYGALRFGLHPAARLLTSRFPLLRIWRANRDETLDENVIDLDCGGDQLLLLRRNREVEIHRLSAVDYSFLDALARGATLSEALDAAECADAGTDSAPLLGRYVSLGVIVDFAVHARPGRHDGAVHSASELGSDARRQGAIGNPALFGRIGTD